ncbi:hypothetical protein ACIQUM_05370 [Amycolatopsis azurea]|uniref:hypothetical protein n=1 Tax=Amycolatopsis azurea TaxID=36819 RepID=UPI00382FE9B1
MSVETEQTQDPVEAVTVSLAREFSSRLSSTAVGVIVRATHRELRRQAVTETYREMLHRLAHHRVARVVEVL